MLAAEPNFFLQAHEGPAYDVKFYGDDADSLLLRFVFFGFLFLFPLFLLVNLTCNDCWIKVIIN